MNNLEFDNMNGEEIWKKLYNKELNTKIIAELVHTSKALPWRTALLIPSGMEIIYISSVLQSPSEMETGIFSIIKSVTLASRKKLLPKSKCA